MVFSTDITIADRMERPKKVIFLDFDGVITVPPKWNIEPEKIKLVKKIVDATGAKIVVSSSWRRDTVEKTIESIFRRNDRNRTISWLTKNMYDVTPWVGIGKGRGGEIQKWLVGHPEVENYVILDDDSDMLDSQLFHFVETSYDAGLTEAEVMRSIRVLNCERQANYIALNFTLRYEWMKKCEGLENRFDDLQKYRSSTLEV